jgi:hypothetical protein
MNLKDSEMSKDAYYFPHDSNARHDPKVIAMMAVYGAEGYGWYWIVVELLREQKDYKYPLSNKYAYNVIAKEMGVEVDRAIQFIGDCVGEFGLLDSNVEELWSNSLLDRMAPLDARREQARSAAHTRWNGKKKPQPEKKVKPKKVNPAKVKNMEVLTNQSYWELFRAELLADDEFKSLTVDYLETRKNKCVDWIKSVGKKYSNYRSMFKNWIRRDMEASQPKKNGMIF